MWQNWRFDVPNERVLGPFKYGVGKLIAHSYPNVPIVLPVYHTGMSGIIPEVQQQTTDSEMPDRISKPKRKKSKASKPISILPRTGNHIEVFVGQPMDFTEDIKEFNAQHPGALTSWGSTLECIRLYEHITDKVRLQMEVLEAEAYGRQVAPTVMEDQEPHEETVVQKIEIVGSSFAFSEPVAV